MATATPIGRKPGYFLLIAFLHGLLAVILIPTILLIGLFVTFGESRPVSIGVGDVLLGLFFIVMVEVICIMAISFLAQFFNALTMFWRALSAEPDAKIGTHAQYGRYVELLPYPTTRWSKYWTNIQENGWKQWRTALGILALILIPFTTFLFPIRDFPLVFLVAAAVFIGIAVYLFVAQIRQWPKKAARVVGPETQADIDYNRGLSYRDQKRGANLRQLKKDALAKKALPSTFDLWVRAEIMEALLDDPGAHVAIRNGSTDAMAGPVRVAFIETEGMVEPDRLRELTLELAAPKTGRPASKAKPAAKTPAEKKPGAKKPVAKMKPAAKVTRREADPPSSIYAPK